MLLTQAMRRPIKLTGNEPFDYDIEKVMKTRKLTLKECSHKVPTNIETLKGQQISKSTYYYCPQCKDFKIIKDIH
jgi:hypothetical protein